ncbi:MAG: hypothetical protein RLZZ301_1346 [Bacteroidota bacterium]|jgi:hypothetical protein
MHIFPSAFFPSIAYTKAVYAVNNPRHDLHEHFIKQSIRSRAEILSANGILALSVPIIHEATKMPLHAIQIDYTTRWQQDHWRAIQSAYAHAPFFDDYKDAVQEIYRTQPRFLHELNSLTWKWIEGVLHQPIEWALCEVFSGQCDTSKKAFLTREDMPWYQQVFGYEAAFVPNLSMLDLIFNMGPFARNWVLPNDQK